MGQDKKRGRRKKSEQGADRHDRLFKELLKTFFTEFMQLFFPAASRAIDFTHLRFLQQEVFTDVTAGERHAVDILVETRLKEEPGLILVHVENQAYVQKDFNERMFIYFSRLYEKYRRRILPIAVFSYDRLRDEPDRFDLGFSFLSVLRFRFYKLEIKKLPWRDYLASDNPVAAALLSKMGFSRRKECRSSWSSCACWPALSSIRRAELIGGFFETYLKLTAQEEEEFYRELDKMDQKEALAIMQITTSWHEKGRLEGRIEGKIEGKIEKTQEIICKFLARRFGVESAEIQEKVRRMTSLETLDAVLTEIFAADSFAEAERVIDGALDKTP